MNKTIEALLRGYILFTVNGKLFFTYNGALSVQKTTTMEGMPVLFTGLHILKGWRCFFMSIVKPSGWRAHSAKYAKGEQPPQTLETLQAAWDRDQELIFEQKDEISKLKETINQLRQKHKE